MLPRVLKNMNLFVDGVGNVGRIKECEPPELKFKMEKTRNGGMDVEKSVDMGQEGMMAKMTFAEFDPYIMKRVGLADTEGTKVVMKGALQRNNETAKSLRIELHGSFDSATLGKWKAGDAADMEIEMNVGYYKAEMDGDLLWEIDAEGLIRNIGGKDVLESIRAAIGFDE